MNNFTAAQPRRLLIVDDERDFVASLADILEEFGYQVDIATTASEAVKLIQSTTYDAAVVDYRMPELNGIELHRRLREIQGDLATILLTAYADQHTHQAAEAAGFWLVIEKPLDVPDIAAKLEGLTQRPLLLVVDDEPDLCVNLQQLFHQHQIRTATCTRLDQAMKTVKNRHFDMVLLDVRFPEGSPLPLLELLQKQNKPAKVLLMTGQAHEGDADLAKLGHLGVSRVHFKPMDMAHLIRDIVPTDSL
jgi:two-component system response regulator HydG